MKQYLLGVHNDYSAPPLPDEEMQRMFARVGAVNEEMQKAGVWVFAGGLLGPDGATVVRAESGPTTMTDGPYAETKEQLGGFWVLNCKDLDEALAWAEKCSAACIGAIEVRPFEEETNDENAG